MTSTFDINLLPKSNNHKNNGNEILYPVKKSTLENFFSPFRKNIIGYHQVFKSSLGKKEIIYADWTASGRAYQPIEEYIQKEIMPFLGNTHNETTITGTLMSKAYEEAKMIVKKHVNASSDDILIFCGSGMTDAVNKLQRILGMRIPERIMDYVKKKNFNDERMLKDSVVSINKNLNKYLQLDEALRPVVFITHMEHHSNQLTWLETVATVEIIN
jgi:selenocysteine lyase/cysteine desulfurase